MDMRTIVLLILPSLYRDEKQNKTDSTKAEDRCYLVSLAQLDGTCASLLSL
jgi:hypothetical protein